MPLSLRHFLAYLLPVLYVAIGAVRATDGSTAAVGALVGLPLLLLVAWQATASKRVAPQVGDVIGNAFRWAALAAAVYGAARTVGPGRVPFDTATALAVPLATAAALVALARIPTGPGLLRCPPAAQRLDAVAAVGFLGAIAATVPALATLSPERGATIDPITIDTTLTAEAAACLLLLFLGAARIWRFRRLELHVVDKAAAATVISGTLAASALGVALLRLAPADRSLPTSVVLASLLVVSVLLVPQAELVGRGLRVVLVASVLGAPLTLMTASVVARAPRQAGGTVLFACVCTLLVGVFALPLARALLPNTSRWLSAIELAQDRVTLAEPQAAVRATLTALRDRLEAVCASPVLFRSESADAVTVDRAGYLHETAATVPAELWEFCLREPAQTFRLEVARALEIRRPDVRPVLAWMEVHGYASATSLHDVEGPVGVLLMPRGHRRTPLTLPEAIALGQLGERLTSVLSLSATLSASRQRQRRVEAEAEANANIANNLQAHIDNEKVRHEADTSRLAAMALVGRYSPAARLTEDALVRVLSGSGPLLLAVPPGVDAVAVLAAAQLRGPRRGHRLVVVDATDTAHQDVHDGTTTLVTTLRHARFATLLLRHAHVLSLDAQRRLAEELRLQEPILRDEAPWLVLTFPSPPLNSTQNGLPRFESSLAARLASCPLVTLPPLADRAEDLRALALAQLGRLGLAIHGQPLGLSSEALRCLLEHPWPGNDVEFFATMIRAARSATGPIVTVADLAFVMSPEKPLS